MNVVRGRGIEEYLTPASLEVNQECVTYVCVHARHMFDTVICVMFDDICGIWEGWRRVLASGSQ